MANKVIVFFGPKSEFDAMLESRVKPGDNTVSYLDSIRVYNSRIRATEFVSNGGLKQLPDYVDNCIVHADDFGSVVSHVIPSFASILEETFDIDNLYVQNPPKRAYDSLISAHNAGQIETIKFKYHSIEKADLSNIYSNLQTTILGQDLCKKAIVTSLYRLSCLRNDKPAAILVYGPSGVGKTETAKCVSESIGGKLTRIQFSMMQTREAYDYLFGSEHSKASFARDLLNRESNVILIDEFDKVNPHLYNMFYQLFDEGKYVDTNYDVDIPDALFILTSNFSSEGEAKKALGPAIFSRLSCCIKFDDLEELEKAEIADRHFNRVVESLDEEDTQFILESDILDWFKKNSSRYNNMRTMKNKIEKAILEKLSESIFQSETELKTDEK